MVVPSLKDRLLYRLRAHVYDASKEVEWIDATMYDDEETVDAYDTAFIEKRLATYESTVDLEFLDMVGALNVRSVLDLGCGAGVFYYLLSITHPNVRYFGYDLSEKQVQRGRTRLGDHFAVRDVSTISRSEFSEYDAVHVSSVFSFMTVPQQLATLRRILSSGALLLTETGVTLPEPGFSPRSCFKHFAGEDHLGRSKMTAISFPYRQEVESVLSDSEHRASYTETIYSNTRALNNSDRSGAAMAVKRHVKRKRPRFERWLPFNPRLKLLMARIQPKAWMPRREYDPSEYGIILNKTPQR